MTVVLMGWGQTNGNYCHGGITTVDLMLPLFVVFKQIEHKTVNNERNVVLTLWLLGHTKLQADQYGLMLPIWYVDNVDCRDEDGYRKMFMGW